MATGVAFGRTGAGAAAVAFVVDFGFSGFSAFATAGFDAAPFSRLTIRSARESFSAEIAASLTETRVLVLKREKGK